MKVAVFTAVSTRMPHCAHVHYLSLANIRPPTPTDAHRAQPWTPPRPHTPLPWLGAKQPHRRSNSCAIVTLLPDPPHLFSSLQFLNSPPICYLIPHLLLSCLAFPSLPLTSIIFLALRPGAWHIERRWCRAGSSHATVFGKRRGGSTCNVVWHGVGRR